MTGGGGFNPDWDNAPSWYQGSDAAPAAAPASGPKRTNPIVAIVAVVVAIVAVAAVGVTVIGNERDRPPPPDSIAMNGADDTRAADGNVGDEGDDVDPLDNARSLEAVNIQPSDLGSEWRESSLIQGNSGLAPCYLPSRPFWKVTTDQYVGYYSTAIREAAPAVSVVGMVSVMETKAEAKRRVASDGAPGFVDCIEVADGDFFGAIAQEEGLRYAEGSARKVDAGKIDTVAWQDVAAFEFPDVGILPLYIDHLIMARGRLRVGVIVSSIVRPFDPARRDLLVSRMIKRLEKLAGTDLATEG